MRFDECNSRSLTYAIRMRAGKIINQTPFVLQQNRLIRDPAALDLGDDVAGPPLRGNHDHLDRILQQEITIEDFLSSARDIRSRFLEVRINHQRETAGIEA